MKRADEGLQTGGVSGLAASWLRLWRASPRRSAESLGQPKRTVGPGALAHATGTAIGQIGLDRLLPGSLRGFGVAGGAFEIFQNRPGLPGLSGVAIGLLALNRPLKLLSGFVVAAELDQRIGQVAS